MSKMNGHEREIVRWLSDTLFDIHEQSALTETERKQMSTEAAWLFGAMSQEPEWIDEDRVAWLAKIAWRHARIRHMRAFRRRVYSSLRKAQFPA